MVEQIDWLKTGSHTICFTGHRPQKLGGYGLNNPLYNALREVLKEKIRFYGYSNFISGMALGFDQMAAWEVLRQQRPLIAAIPFDGQEKMWPTWSQLAYHRLLKRSNEVVNVSEDNVYRREYMLKRNHWMVDMSHLVIACWDGTKGGTSECVRYAETQLVEVINIYPEAKHLI